MDLAALNTDVEAFSFLDRIIVSCGDVLPEAYFVLTKMTIPLQNPAATRITIGDSRASLVADNTGRINGAIDRISAVEKIAAEGGLTEREKERLLSILRKRYGLNKKSIFIK